MKFLPGVLMTLELHDGQLYAHITDDMSVLQQGKSIKQIACGRTTPDYMAVWIFDPALTDAVEVVIATPDAAFQIISNAFFEAQAEQKGLVQ